MGEVLLARDELLDRWVAIKVLLPDVAAVPGARDRFRAEARAMARIRHPHVVGVHSFGEERGLPNLVMEHVPGDTLHRALAKRGPPPLRLDATEHWRFPSPADDLFDGLVCVNMIHISPWAATLGLFENAARTLKQDAFVLLYGPYRRDGKHTAESNAHFDVSLRARNEAWGVRCLDEVVASARPHGFSLERVVEMPRDNLCVVFRFDRDLPTDGKFT